MVQVEVEKKVYLQTPQNADKFLDAVLQLAADDKCFDESSERRVLGESQTNHYFYPTSPVVLQNFQWDRWQTVPDFSYEEFANATSISVRTRKVVKPIRAYDGDYPYDEEVLLVIKADFSGGDASNSAVRFEGEYKFPVDQDTLDAFLLLAGFSLQAKWSRDRDSYHFYLKPNNYLNYFFHDGVTVSVTIDRNAGYGYLAEVEVSSQNDDVKALEGIAERIISNCGFSVMDNALLDAMFQYYNKHWRNYYGTDKTFNIELEGR